MAGNSAEGKNGDHEKNILQIIAEMIKKAALERLRAALSKLEYSPDKGFLGKQLKELGEVVRKLNDGTAINPEEALKEAGKKFEKLTQSLGDFRTARDSKTEPEHLQPYIENRKALANNDGFRNEADQAINNSRAQQEEDGRDYDAAKAKQGEDKEAALVDLKRKVEVKRSEGAKNVRELDKHFREEVNNLLSQIRQFEENNPSLKGASGLFSDQAGEVFGLLDKQRAVVEEVASDNPEAALDSLRKIALLQSEQAAKLNRGDLAELQRRIEEINAKHANILARKDDYQGFRRMSDEEFAALEEREREFFNRVQNGDKKALQAYLSQPDMFDQNLSQGQLAQYLRSSQGMTRRQMAELGRLAQQRGGVPPELLEQAQFMGQDMEGGALDLSDPERAWMGRQIYGTPESHYQMQRDQVLKDYGELNYHVLKDYVQMKIADVTRTENSTYTNDLMQNIVAVKTLLNSNEIKDPKIWGLTADQHGELVEQVAGFLAMYDFGVGARFANTEQIWGMAKRTGGMDNFIKAYNYSMELNLRVLDGAGNESVADPVSVSAGELANLLETKYWAKRALSKEKGKVRDKAAKEMVLYVMAKKLGLEAAKNAQTGLVDFNKLQIKTVGNHYEVSMGGNVVRIAGYEDLKLVNGSKKRSITELDNQIIGMGYYAQYTEKAFGRLALFDLWHSGDVNDSQYKYMDDRYSAKYKIPLHMEIMMATDPRRRDLITQTFYKAISTSYQHVGEANNISKEGMGEFTGDLGKFMDLALKNSKNWLMTPEQILENWEALFVKMKVHNDLGQEVDRFSYLTDDHQIHEAHELMHQFLKDDFEWAPLIKMMMGNKDLGGMNTTGMEGFRNAIINWDRRNLYNASAETDKWADVEGDEYKGGLWVDDFDKHYDYMNRIARGFSARVAFAKNPNWDNRLKLLEESGSYDFMDRPMMGEVSIRLQNELARLQQYNWINNIYKTDHDRSLIAFDPKKHGGTAGVEADGPRKGVNEEGVQLYEKDKFYASSRGRDRGWSKSPRIRKEEIEQLYRAGLISHHQEQQMLQTEIEHLWGWRPKSKVGGFFWGGDPFGRLAETRWRTLHNRFRIGIGPTIGWFKLWWASFDKRLLLEETFEQYFEILGHEMKKSLDMGGGH